MTKHIILAAASVAAIALAGTANAATLSFGDLYSTTGTLAAGEVMLNDFSADSASVTGTGFGYYTGLTDGVAAPPAGNTSRYLAVRGGGDVTIDFGTIASSFSIDLGSIDTYNKLQILFQNAGTGEWQGSEFGNGLYNGDQFAAQSNRRFTFTAQGSELFTGIKLVSDQNSFEVDNLAITVAAVPEPATWAMMLGGFGLIGAAARRRRETGLALAGC